MSNEHDIRLKGLCFLCRAFFFLITLAWLGCLMSVKLLLPPLCTGWHELATDWLRPSHDNISQAVSSERERGAKCTPSEDSEVRSVKREECCTTGGDEERLSQHRVPVWGQAL